MSGFLLPIHPYVRVENKSKSGGLIFLREICLGGAVYFFFLGGNVRKLGEEVGANNGAGNKWYWVGKWWYWFGKLREQSAKNVPNPTPLGKVTRQFILHKPEFRSTRSSFLVFKNVYSLLSKSNGEQDHRKGEGMGYFFTISKFRTTRK